MSKYRGPAGATLSLSGVLAFIMVVLCVGLFSISRIIFGGAEFQNATDAGVLNVSKKALYTPSVRCSEVGNPDTTEFIGLGEGAARDEFNLNNINRVWAHAMMVGANATGMKNDNTVKDYTFAASANRSMATATDEAGAHAVKLHRAAQDLSAALAQKLKNQKNLEPFFNEYVGTSSGNSIRMLDMKSQAAAANGWRVAYVSKNTAANVSLDKDQLIVPGQRYEYVYDAETMPGMTVKQKNDRTYLNGYKAFPLTEDGHKSDFLNLHYYFVPLFPSASPYVISKRNFEDNIKSDFGNGLPWKDAVPNSFEAIGQANDQKSNSILTLAAYGKSEPMTEGYKSRVSHGFIRIHNGPAALYKNARESAGEFANHQLLDVRSHGQRPYHDLAVKLKEHDGVYLALMAPGAKIPLVDGTNLVDGITVNLPGTQLPAHMFGEPGRVLIQRIADINAAVRPPLSLPLLAPLAAQIGLTPLQAATIYAVSPKITSSDIYDGIGKQWWQHHPESFAGNWSEMHFHSRDDEGKLFSGQVILRDGREQQDHFYKEVGQKRKWPLPYNGIDCRFLEFSQGRAPTIWQLLRAPGKNTNEAHYLVCRIHQRILEIDPDFDKRVDCPQLANLLNSRRLDYGRTAYIFRDEDSGRMTVRLDNESLPPWLSQYRDEQPDGQTVNLFGSASIPLVKEAKQIPWADFSYWMNRAHDWNSDYNLPYNLLHIKKTRTSPPTPGNHAITVMNRFRFTPSTGYHGLLGVLQLDAFLTTDNRASFDVAQAGLQKGRGRVTSWDSGTGDTSDNRESTPADDASVLINPDDAVFRAPG